ncbi:sulfotransferase [Plakobranchus ocellatus]|uniref:Sulfotransferase n=1 Tax=Plakobranchus ocellatus TaxID=259542 RepID=A0AAV4CDN9_9GAST|nr:sulfotransferase [Plakobranchus ocellatus]
MVMMAVVVMMVEAFVAVAVALEDEEEMEAGSRISEGGDSIWWGVSSPKGDNPEADEVLQFESKNVASPGTKIANNQHPQNTSAEIKRIAKFIGCPADDSLVNQIVHKSSFDNMRKTKGENETFDGNFSPVMYRKGKVGDWKNWFTVAQSEQFDAVFEQEMQGTKAHELYSHAKPSFTGPDRNMNER